MAGPATRGRNDLDRRIGQLVTAAAEELVTRFAAADRHWRQNGQADCLAKSIAKAIDDALARLRETNLWGPDNRMASNAFWQIAEPWLRYGDLQVRARTKPRGYAGDYELLCNICERTCCQHPIGNAMDQYFLNEAAPRAVRTRTRLVADRLIERCGRSQSDPLRIVSVGSGPAIELQQTLERLSREDQQRVRITLLDLDQKALDHARNKLLPWVGLNALKTLRVNLSRLPGNARLAAEISPADYLFCPGFFDYLDDAAGTMLAWFRRSLAPGGELTVFNFMPANASRAYMEWIGNWYLIYRDEAAMRSLAEPLEGTGNVNVRSIEQGTLVELTIHSTT